MKSLSFEKMQEFEAGGNCSKRDQYILLGLTTVTVGLISWISFGLGTFAAVGVGAMIIEGCN